jgi:hypothetical protein
LRGLLLMEVLAFPEWCGGDLGILWYDD